MVGDPDAARQVVDRRLEGLVQLALGQPVALAGACKDLIRNWNIEGAGHDL
jgi:hypothetical protein